MTIISVWLAVRQAIFTSPLLEIQNVTSSRVGVIVIMILILIMFAGLMYRILFTLAMFYISLLQKMLLKGSDSWLLWSGFVLAIFPSLPVVEPQQRIVIV